MKMCFLTIEMFLNRNFIGRRGMFLLYPIFPRQNNMSIGIY
jgi:hypothetical protein